MPLVIDASVASKWFIIEDGTAPAMTLLDTDKNLIAPDLIFSEVCSVMWKKVRMSQMASEQARAAIQALPGFFDDLILCQQLAPRALKIATSLDHPVYDCFYLALAEEKEAQMVTADTRLLGRLRGSDWSKLATGLEV